MTRAFLLAGSFLAALTLTCAAQDYDPYSYRGSSGTTYQYDLSNPSDQLRYGVDPMAQMRDQMNVNPGVEIDRGLGQYGGGVNPE
jgi:hypothetical protein